MTDVPEGHRGLSPNPWNGQLSDPDVLAKISETYGSKRVWSASQLEAYGACPFVFLVDRVLGIKERGEADEETTPLTFGGVAHDVLERFYGDLLTALPASLDSTAETRLDDAIEHVVDERQGSGEWMGNPALWENTKEQIRETLHAYVAWELEYMAETGERPAAVERSFGFDDEPPVELTGRDLAGAQGRLLVRGRVDRIDEVTAGDGVVHRVLDYKSSSVPSASGTVMGASCRRRSTSKHSIYSDTIRRRVGIVLSKKPTNRRTARRVTFGGRSMSVRCKRLFDRSSDSPWPLLSLSWLPVRVEKSWHPGSEITRSRAKLPKGASRFDG